MTRKELESKPIRNMVAAGAVTSNSFRLWIRTEDPGRVVVSWRREGDPGSFFQKTVFVAPQNLRDNTVGTTIGGMEAPLNPMTRYEYRATLGNGEKIIGKGVAETAPADAATTPERFSIAFMSCNQPFEPDGSVNRKANPMLRAVRRALEKHDAKFVLMIGDQMYADMPRRFSLFNPDYLGRISSEAVESIFDCSSAEIRRLYQRRYRQFWSIPGWSEIHGKFPVYMMWDDHDIVDNWGSSPSHQSPRWQTIMDGARRAFMDYQGSLALESTMVLPDAFDFGIRYGTVAVYVLDIRSNRRAGKNGRIYSSDQFLRFRRFLDGNADADALFVVLTVPVVHLPRHVAKLATRLFPEQEDFSDRWSTGVQIFDRDRLLRLLRRNQKANPHQFLALLGGDIHSGCAQRLGFGDARIYQFVSSAVTHDCDPFTKTGSEWLIRVNRTFETFDKGLRGKVDLLENDGPGKNPYGGLNVGIVEIVKSCGNSRSRVRFHLYGHRGSMPVCVYRSKLL